MTDAEIPATSTDAPKRTVGIDLVDLLFALVVFELIEPLREPGEIVLVGWWHLAVGLSLTLLSWIGYHSSLGAVDEYKIKVGEPPFWHVLLDVAMVVVYWLTAITYERRGDASDDVSAPWSVVEASAVPEAWFTFATFVLYLMWDWLAGFIHVRWKGAARRWTADEAADNKVRRVPTFIATGVCAVLLLIAHATSGQTKWVVAVDVALIAVVFGFRFGKELASGRSATKPELLRRAKTGLWGLRLCAATAVAWFCGAAARDIW